MGEESFYTDKVNEYRTNSRFPTLSRYRDLIGFLRNVFKDGIVTNEELFLVQKVEKDILLEYELAADIYSKIQEDSPRKDAAKRLLKHLYRCFVIISFAQNRAKIQNSQGDKTLKNPNERIIRRTPSDFILSIQVNKSQHALMNDLSTQIQRIEADLPRIRKDLAKLPMDERLRYESQINAAIDHIERVNSEHLNVAEMNRILGLEQHLKNEKERIHE